MQESFSSLRDHFKKEFIIEDRVIKDRNSGQEVVIYGTKYLIISFDGSIIGNNLCHGPMSFFVREQSQLRGGPDFFIFSSHEENIDESLVIIGEMTKSSSKETSQLALGVAFIAWLLECFRIKISKNTKRLILIPILIHPRKGAKKKTTKRTNCNNYGIRCKETAYLSYLTVTSNNFHINNIIECILNDKKFKKYIKELSPK